MPRAADIDEITRTLEKTDDDRVYLKFGPFDVRLVHTDEGMVVDIFPWREKDSTDPVGDAIATTYAFESDCDPEEVAATMAASPSV